MALATRHAPDEVESEFHAPHVRSPVDLIRVATGAALIVSGIALANLFDSTMFGLAEDTSSNAERLPDWSRDVATAVMGALVISGAVAVALWSLLTTRYRRFALFVCGIGLAAAISVVAGRVVYDIVDPSVRGAFEDDVPLFRVTGADGRLSPADPLLAAAIATLTIGGSFLPRRMVRRGAVLVAVYALASILTVDAPPLALLTDLGAGLLAGSALLWIFGRHDLSLRPSEIRSALATAGITVDELVIAPEASGDGWRATRPSGETLFVVAFSRDDRSADLIMRAVRWVRLRKTGDHRPFLSLRRTVEHEALVAQQARNRGIDTPMIKAVAGAGVDGMILAREWISAGDPSETHPPSDHVLATTWHQAALLQRAHITHGALNLSNVVVDEDGHPRLIDFHRGELTATEQRLGTDMAELLASTAVAVGTPTAVRIAHDAMTSDQLERAVPWLQPLALTAVTRRALGDSLDELRSETIAACGLEPEEPVRLERIEPKSLFILVTIVLSAWFLLPQLADLDSLWSQAKGASWPWACAAVLFSMATYLAATGSLLGAIPSRLRYWPAVTAQIASSFANRVTPAKVGGIATNLRYFQRQGVPTAVSATAVGLNAVAGLIMHAVLTVFFLLLASGQSTSEGLSLPSTASVALAAAALGVMVGTATAVPSSRRLLTIHVVPQLRSGWASLRIIAHDPARLLLLFGGSAAITLCYLAAMVASLRAFGSTAPVPLVGLLFLTGSAVANAAPTPGGLGAAEAALIAALSTIEEPEIVVPAVFLYRLVTFWLPILPGWIALTYLRRTDNL